MACSVPLCLSYNVWSSNMHWPSVTTAAAAFQGRSCCVSGIDGSFVMRLLLAAAGTFFWGLLLQPKRLPR